MQDWSALLEQGCLDQFGGNTESDDHVLLSGSTVIADFIDIPQKEDDMSSKKQLRYLFDLRPICSCIDVYVICCVQLKVFVV